LKATHQKALTRLKKAFTEAEERMQEENEKYKRMLETSTTGNVLTNIATDGAVFPLYMCDFLNPSTF